MTITSRGYADIKPYDDSINNEHFCNVKVDNNENVNVEGFYTTTNGLPAFQIRTFQRKTTDGWERRTLKSPITVLFDTRLFGGAHLNLDHPERRQVLETVFDPNNSVVTEVVSNQIVLASVITETPSTNTGTVPSNDASTQNGQATGTNAAPTPSPATPASPPPATNAAPANPAPAATGAPTPPPPPPTPNAPSADTTKSPTAQVFDTIDKAKIWVEEQIKRAPENMKTEWEKIQASLPELYKNNGKLAVDKGKVIISELGDWFSKQANEIKSAFQKVQENPGGIWDMMKSYVINPETNEVNTAGIMGAVGLGLVGLLFGMMSGGGGAMSLLLGLIMGAALMFVGGGLGNAYNKANAADATGKKEEASESQDQQVTIFLDGNGRKITKEEDINKAQTQLIGRNQTENGKHIFHIDNVNALSGSPGDPVGNRDNILNKDNRDIALVNGAPDPKALENIHKQAHTPKLPAASKDDSIPAAAPTPTVVATPAAAAPSPPPEEPAKPLPAAEATKKKDKYLAKSEFWLKKDGTEARTRQEIYTEVTVQPQGEEGHEVLHIDKIRVKDANGQLVRRKDILDSLKNLNLPARNSPEDKKAAEAILKEISDKANIPVAAPAASVANQKSTAVVAQKPVPINAQNAEKAAQGAGLGPVISFMKSITSIGKTPVAKVSSNNAVVPDPKQKQAVRDDELIAKAQWDLLTKCATIDEPVPMLKEVPSKTLSDGLPREVTLVYAGPDRGGVTSYKFRGRIDKGDLLIYKNGESLEEGYTRLKGVVDNDDKIKPNVILDNDTFTQMIRQMNDSESGNGGLSQNRLAAAPPTPKVKQSGNDGQILQS